MATADLQQSLLQHKVVFFLRNLAILLRASGLCFCLYWPCSIFVDATGVILACVNVELEELTMNTKCA